MALEPKTARTCATIAALGLACGSPLAGCKEESARIRTPVVIGAVLPLTGPQAAYGVSAKSGIDLAAARVEAEGGLLGRRVEVVYIDDQGDREQAKAATARLVDKEGAVLLLGEVSSSASLAMAPLAQRARIPMISPSATAPELTQHGDFVFRTCFADPFQAEVLARYAAEALGAEKVGVLRDLDSAYSLELSRAFEAAAKARGLDVVAVTELSAEDTSVDEPLEALAAAGAQWVYFPSYVEPVRRVLEAAARLEVPYHFLGSDGWDAQALETLGPAAEGHVFVSHFDPEAPEAHVKDFVLGFRARFNERPDAYAALGYDAARLGFDAIRRAGRTEPEALREALAETDRFDGVTGALALDPGGDPKKAAVLMKIEDGARVRVQP